MGRDELLKNFAGLEAKRKKNTRTFNQEKWSKELDDLRSEIDGIEKDYQKYKEKKES